MRHDAARALRVDDDWAELRSIGSLLDVELPPSMRRFERTDGERAGAPVVALAGPESAMASESRRRFAREETAARPRVARERPRARVAREAVEPRPESVHVPRTAPGRAYGSHRRGEGGPAPLVAGPQPGRRTVEITGYARTPRRRPSQTSAALAAQPDRVALWAFLFALFVLVMALVTAHG